MPRHWHPVKFASIKVINVSYDGKMDSSVKHWNNTKDPNYGLNKEIKVQLRRGKQGKLEYFSNN